MVTSTVFAARVDNTLPLVLKSNPCDLSTGPTGSTGPAGPVGVTGPTGSTGLTGPTGSTGLNGTTGPFGPTGLSGGTGPSGSVGVTGPFGPTGSTGATGIAGPIGTTSSSLIPFGSDTLITLSGNGGAATTAALLGFGSSIDNVSFTGGVLAGNNLASGNYAFAFSMPEAGVINSLALYFTNNASASVTAGSFIEALIFTSPTPDNAFTPVGTVQIPIPGTSIAPFTSFSGAVTGLNLPVTAQTRILVGVLFVSQGGTPTSITGYAGAGLGLTMSP
jgi:BclB C-terminal domain-containing protein